MKPAITNFHGLLGHAISMSTASARQKLEQTLANLGQWTHEIVSSSDVAKGRRTIAAAIVEQTFSRKRPSLAYDRERQDVLAQARHGVPQVREL